MKLGIRESIDQIKTFSRIFVERPRFAMVISIVLTMAGVMAIWKLPISQYPQLTPPSISVSYNYPGANAKEVLNTVAMPIEDEVNGVDDMLYIIGQCGDDGSYSLNISFEVESNRDMDMVKVQNRVAQAEAKLPTEVKQLGGRIRAQAEDMLGVISILSPKGTFSRLQLSDYVYSNIQPVLLRVPGVGECQVYGPKLSMRVWLDADRMAALGMNSEEVIAAVSKQNVQASIGAVGATPVEKNAQWTMSLVAKGRLMTPKEFDEIIVRRDAEGGIVRLKDVARTEVGEQMYMFSGQLNGENVIQIALQQKPGANAIATMDQIYKEMAKLKESFPEDMDWNTPYDATEYVRVCIKEIVETLIITFLLVVFVCYLFLQDWRATLIPCITIPVSLCSTFILMAALGYSINILTLFGLVLAIGVVVDDCIVVVERVQFLIETRGLNAKEATIQAMKDVTSAVIATTLVLLGIFVPVGFMSGITGRIYQQFSVTLSAAVCFSTVCALTLAPALTSLLLHEARPFKHGPLAWFNLALEKFKGFFVKCAKWLASRIFLALTLLVLTIMLCISAFMDSQTAFLPDEDQRVILGALEMPEGSTRDRTTEVALRANELLHERFPEVNNVLTITGWGIIGGRGENLCTLIIDFTTWDQRKRPDQHVLKLLPRLKAALAEIPEPKWTLFAPPAIPGVGAVNGVAFNLQDKGTADPMRMNEVMREVLMKLNMNPMVQAAFSGYNADTPHLRFMLDRVKAEMYKVPVATVYSTLQNYLGSRYVNDVNLGTQVNRVTVQSDWNNRATPEAVERLYVRSDNGAMVPIGSLGTIVREKGPRTVFTRDKYVACGIQVLPAEGVATGELMNEIERVLKDTIPEDFGFDWVNLSYQEKRNEGTAGPLILLAILFGYLFLVAQYESWTIPLPVMLSIFVAVFGALTGLKYWGIIATGQPYPLSIYGQLGLVLLIGLASKNAILIVEFAKDKHEIEGLGIVEAAGLAAGERLRALLMTALTTLLGTLPMMIATGAGASSRNHLGTTEFFGMLFSVVFGILLVPGLYALFQTWRETAKRCFAKIGAAAAAAVVAGCTCIPSVGPDYTEPEVKTSATALPDAGATSNMTERIELTDKDIADWWKRFDDPILNELIDEAVSNNYSYLIAVKTLEQTQYELLGSYAAFLPKFAANGAWLRNWYHDQVPAGNFTRSHYNVQQAALDGNWEIDIFGGSRRATESAIANAEAAGWSVANAYVSLTTQIGMNYINLRTTQQRLEVAQTNLVLQSETYEILKSRLDSGIGDELAVNQCSYIVEQTRAAIPRILAQEEALKNALAVLTGKMPGDLHERLKPIADKGHTWLIAPRKLETIPLNLLRERPDVKLAERQLAAQSAAIGVAKAQWFPRFFVSGTIGYQSKNGVKLFDADSFFASLGPSVSWPIFQGGAIYANVKATEAKTEAAALRYAEAIELAYQDVRNAYSAYTQEYHRYEALTSAVKAATDAVAIAQDLYKTGLKDFNNVLDAQRSRLQLEEQYVISRGEITLNLIALYKALGGGIAVK